MPISFVMNLALLLIIGPNHWHHFTAITTRKAQNNFFSFFLPHRLEDNLCDLHLLSIPVVNVY